MSESPDEKKAAVKKFFSWRAGFMESDLSSTTKLVLHTIASHMNSWGEGAFPSIQRIMAEASLSNRAVVTHIEEAVSRGWLKKHLNSGRGKGWKHSSYSTSWPSIGSEIGSPPGQAVNVVPNGSGRSSILAVNLVPSNSPCNSPMNGERDAGEEYQPKNLYLEIADSLRALERIWNDHPSARHAKWEEPQYSSTFTRYEEYQGREIFRKAWVAYLNATEIPTALGFLYTQPKPPCKQRHRRSAEQVTGLSDADRIRKILGRPA